MVRNEEQSLCSTEGLLQFKWGRNLEQDQVHVGDPPADGGLGEEEEEEERRRRREEEEA
ncbi:hypothetical protein D4764_15G0000970 [Takifugu flavidus]|uniref:Uncharacterized protein n=1 Tax=Takifugu flavidus TaxID=433684 RepID=A0A5C6NZK5_9TELE|nr:hypothetical protein D4764_15G0000970 [Takifugu flavidus]